MVCTEISWLYTHNNKVQLDYSARRLCDGVDAIHIVRVVVWIRWWGKHAIWKRENSTTGSLLSHSKNSLRKFLTWLISHFKSFSTLMVVWCKSVDDKFIKWKVFSLMHLPDSQIIPCAHYHWRNICTISTECSHKWRVLRITIPQLNKIWYLTSFLTLYINICEWDIDTSSIGLWDKIDTIGQGRVCIWIIGRGE